MERVQKEIDNLVTIGNWAKSCKTKEQLQNVDKFFHNHMSNIKPFNKWEMGKSHRVMFHCGIVSGMLLSIKKLKFKKQ